MSKLLRANFARLWKSKVFWICIIFMAGLDIYFIHMDGERFKMLMIRQSFFSCNTFGVIAGAVFTGIFIGTEYGDGTIRNKLAVGHSRFEVYFANFITCMTACLIMYFVWIIIQLFSGAYSLINEENVYFPAGRIPILLFCSLAALVAQTAISLFISMLVHKRLAGVATVIIATIASLFIAQGIQERLEVPEYYGGTLIHTDDNGEEHVEYDSDTRNPRYLAGTKRKIYESAYHILPFCQLFQIAQLDYYYYSVNFNESGHENPLEHTELFPVYSICIFMAVSGGGIFLFRKKDIK